MKLLLLLLPVLALVGGTVAGELLAPKEAGMEAMEGETMADAAEAEADAEDPLRNIVGLNRRLIVPIVTDRQMRAVVLLDVAVDIPDTMTAEAHAALPRLRDAFLRRMLALSAGGAFRRGVSDPTLVDQTRDLLAEDARLVLGTQDVEVLILEAIMRAV
ncbi:MAG: hypothetical protein AAF416_10220 [Pseudomonadota bacterium]